MKRFRQFSKAQAGELAKAMNDHWKRVIMVDLILIVALAIGFGYGLQRVADASSQADAANRAAQQIIRDRASDARRLASENQAKADEGAKLAYAACRRQQESTIAARLAVKVMLANPDPTVHHLAVHYENFLNAQHLLDVPDCPKPPKGTG